jgi:hypothetical protein
MLPFWGAPTTAPPLTTVVPSIVAYPIQVGFFTQDPLPRQHFTLLL